MRSGSIKRCRQEADKIRGPFLLIPFSVFEDAMLLVLFHN